MEIGLDTELNCRNCGSEYEFTELESPKTGTNKEFCDICGKELLNWPAEQCCEMHRVAK